MLTNLIQSTWRYLVRQKIYTSLHVIGLTLGITVCLLIALFIRYELSFDAYHPNTGNTYRLVSDWIESKEVSHHFSTPFPLANAVRSEASGFEQVAFFHPVYVNTIEVTPQKRLLLENIIAVEPEFLDIFSVDVLEGDLRQTLQKPYQAALTESTAKKMFGSENPIGKTFKFRIREDFEFTVTSIIRDLPANTHFKASMFLSHSYQENFLKGNRDGWTYVSGTETFITLPANADTSVFRAQLRNIAEKYINAKTGPLYKSDFSLQPLSSVHFDTNLSDSNAMSITWLWFFGMIGLAVLALACINFVNLTTAQALTRAKEVGIRKSVGAGRGSLITQFLTEAWVLTFASGIAAIALTQLLLPYFNNLLSKGILFDPLDSPVVLTTLVIALAVTGLLAGIYPAWVIAKFNPSITLKVGVLKSQGGGAWLRKSLVVGQFTVSACLLMVVILMSEQLDYLRSKNLGFDKDHVVVVDISKPVQTISTFKNELLSLPAVAGVSFSTSTPSSTDHWGTPMSRLKRDDPDRKPMTLILADDNYEKLYGLTLLAGRALVPSDTLNVSRSIPEDQQVMNAMVNEQLVRDLGFESNEAALGQRMYIGFNSGKVDIVGVVANFNQGPLNNATRPVLMTSSARAYSLAGIKLEKGTNIPQAIAAIETAWKKTYPEGVFAYKFLDEQIDAYYKAEERLFNLFRIFAAVAMLISCLGLFALATFTTQQRVKEIGIRKVLGASVNSILMLVSSDYLRLVSLALVVATPLAWYGISQWLTGYAFHIDITGWAFALAGAIAIAVTLTTIGTQALKSAMANPAESLKNE